MNRIGVCSWSLRPASPAALAEAVRSTGLEHVQLALDPLRAADGPWRVDATVASLNEAGITIVSGMMATAGEDYSSLASIERTGGVRPDEHWEANLAIARADAALAQRLSLGLVSFHAGFLPAKRGEPEREVMLERLRTIVDVFSEHGVRTCFETGQETAATLADFLEELDREDAGVNFDPANMILYDKGDPVDALGRLLPWVRQIHVKDALRTNTPGTWGTEVPVGEGEVDWVDFFGLVTKKKLDCDLLIEREAGDTRGGDIALARELVEGLLPRKEKS